MRFRKLMSFTLAFALLIVLLLPMSANADVIPIAPTYINTSSIRCSLSFSGDLAKCGAAADGHYGTTKVSGTMTLQRRNSDGTYSGVKSWSASENSDLLVINETWFVERGYYYRVYFTAEVTRNGTTESVSWWGGDVKCE